MMFPNSVSSPPPAPATAPIPDASTEADGKLVHHADYDLRPIAVPSLAHYLMAPEEGERFHVH
jgi:hypothetical protein